MSPYVARRRWHVGILVLLPDLYHLLAPLPPLIDCGNAPVAVCHQGIGHGDTEREILHSGPRGAAKRRPRRCSGRRALTGRRGREEETDTCENARNKQPMSIHE